MYRVGETILILWFSIGTSGNVQVVAIYGMFKIRHKLKLRESIAYVQVAQSFSQRGRVTPCPVQNFKNDWTYGKEAMG